MGGLQAIFQLDMPIFIYDNTPQGKKTKKENQGEHDLQLLGVIL